MKGIIFVELLEMIDRTHGEHITDSVIERAKFGSQCAYTTVGNYASRELTTLVKYLSVEVNKDTSFLFKDLGRHLLERFFYKYPKYFTSSSCSFDFLEKINDVIHPEVLKLYPEAELPQFHYKRLSDDNLIIEYKSARPFADLAEGLIIGAISIFGEDITMKVKDLSDGRGTNTQFILKAV